MSVSPAIRVVTNSDLDALVSAVLLKRVEPVGAVKFLPLEDLRTDTYRACASDILVNIPFVRGCAMWFDHHDTNPRPEVFEGRYDPRAPSAARVVYDYYAARDREDRFEGLEELLLETDKVDSAQFTREDILNPEGAVLLSFLIEGEPHRTGTVSENQLMITLLNSGDPQRVLTHPLFAPKVETFLEQQERSLQALEEELLVERGLMILDFCSMDPERRVLCKNKFLPYVIHPDSHTLLQIKDLNEAKVKLSLGFNMFRSDRHCPVHYGELLAQFDGGGHRRAAGCSLPRSELDQSLRIIRDRILSQVPAD